MTEVFNLTSELIKRRSVTPDDGGCLQLILDYLGPDFKAEWLNFEDTKNLLLTHGEQAPHLMLLGHVDVVPAGDETAWTSPAFEASLRDGKLYGRGACDMKSGVAAMAVALKRYVLNNPAHSGSISLLLTSDEEGSNKNGIPKVVEEFNKRGTKIDYCIVGEPTSKEALADTIKIGRRGTLSGILKVFGVQGHIAYPHLADNPIHRFAPILEKLCKHCWDKGNQFFAPTSLQFSNINSGVGATNVIPAQLEAKFNFRFSTIHTPDSLIKTFESFFESEEIKYEIFWEPRGLPFLTKKGKLIEAVQKVIQSQLGKEAKLDTGGGTSDARFIAPLGTEVIELGLRGESMHKVDEFVRIEELEPLANLYGEILERILAKES